MAVEKAPVLHNIFPSFVYYVVFAAVIGIPILTLIGWTHWKKSGARRAEVDVNYEANPYEARAMVNSEMVLKLSLQLAELVLKNQQKEPIDAQRKSWLHAFNVSSTCRQHHVQRKCNKHH